MAKEAAASMQRLQSIEQALGQLEQQRQQVQSQLFEIDSAIASLKGVTKSYKIVGNIMVDAKPDELLKELQQKKEVLEVRNQSIEKQEQKLRDNAKSLQEDLRKPQGGAQ